MIVHKRSIRPNDLKAGQVKVVVYSKGDLVMIGGLERAWGYCRAKAVDQPTS